MGQYSCKEKEEKKKANKNLLNAWQILPGLRFQFDSAVNEDLMAVLGMLAWDTVDYDF